MMGRALAVAVLSAVACLGGCMEAPAAPSVTANNDAVYDIPYLPQVTVDGKDTDWAGGGYRVDLLTPVSGDLKRIEDHAARVRLAWCDKGVLMTVYVRDDRFLENPAVGSLYSGDAIEVFLAPAKGHRECVQWCISPGMTSDQPNLRWNLHDGRTAEMKTRKAELVAARTKLDTGYILEALLPFESLDIKPELGRELGLQVWVDDVDAGQPQYWAAWYPALGSIYDHNNMHRVRLAKQPSMPMVARATCGYDVAMLETSFSVVALKEQAGKKVTVMNDGKPLVSGTLSNDTSGRSQARLTAPMPAPGQSYGQLAVYIDNKPAQSLTIGSSDLARANALIFTDVVAKPSVFSGSALPPVVFDNPYYMRHLIGPYELKTTYYDNEYKEVTQATKPGRYGAVTEIKANGRIYRRFTTLFRMSEDMQWWRTSAKGSFEWPKQVGVTPEMAAKHTEFLNDFYKWTIADSADRNNWLASTLAGLYETSPDQKADDFYANPEMRDRQWWVGLKRKVFGYDKLFTKPYDRPVKIDGAAARVIREGTLAEAGMKPDADKKIDAMLTQWAGDTDEAFAVCIARHGVIVLHKAYGTRDGKPMTVDTPSEMASATKMISGTMMLTLLDQNMITLDNEACTYLPPLKGIKNNRPLTVRHLYTHTSGVENMAHWGADLNDLEERYAILMPTLQVGKASAYNGTSMELACRILENASGHSLPDLYAEHLLRPLGCTPTSRFCHASYGTQATPLEVARILQMVLNKGAYGQYRWFGEETYQQLLPIDLEEKTGAKGNYGLGTAWMSDGSLSDKAFGHGAASSATIRVDPTLDLVIVMTRNSAGRNFDKYHPQFIKTIVDGITDKPATQPAAK